MSCKQQQGGEVKLESAADSAGYAIGILVGSNNKQQINSVPGGKEINLEAMNYGFSQATLEKEGNITMEEADEILRNYIDKASAVAGQSNLEAGNSFLEENRKRDGVTVTGSGLQYEILKEGTGSKPTSEDQVRVHYHGTLLDGKVFDSSVDRGEPVVFGVTQVIPGWTEALQLMSEGSKWKIYLPSELAYGERGAGGDIGPNSTLIFEVELLEIVKE
ncbi:MAG: FKBP-type peptidyl-prolyl cis-trans isomerase [Prolixibacteraceae bacterium]|nr:FKBP-type peptidyl-prolyl cis-trans isomerase [Prolixibacteraceae bacterium]